MNSKFSILYLNELKIKYNLKDEFVKSEFNDLESGKEIWDASEIIVELCNYILQNRNQDQVDLEAEYQFTNDFLDGFGETARQANELFEKAFSSNIDFKELNNN